MNLAHCLRMVYITMFMCVWFLYFVPIIDFPDTIFY